MENFETTFPDMSSTGPAPEATSDFVAGELHDHPQTFEASRRDMTVGEGPLRPEGFVPSSIINLVRAAGLEAATPVAQAPARYKAPGTALNQSESLAAIMGDFQELQDSQPS